MSRADDFARTLMKDAGGGQSVVPADDPAPDVMPLAPVAGEGVTVLPVEQLQRGRYQPRGAIDPESLTELADSIRAQGIVQPIVVRPIDAGHFEIVAGERRWRAAQLAGLSSVPVVVRYTRPSLCPIQNGSRSALFASSPATLIVANCRSPGVEMTVSEVAAMPYSGSAVPLRDVLSNPSSPMMPSSPAPPEIQS